MSDLFLDDEVRIWAEKTQLVWTKIPDFLKMFPRGKVIHVIRDPRSVLASFKKYTYAPKPAYLGAIFNCYDSMKMGLKYRSEFASNRYFLVKYEDILTIPEATVGGLFDFLELSKDHNLLSQNGWLDAHGNPWYHNSAFLSPGEQDSEFDRPAAIHRWKDNLSDEEISLCEAINGQLLEAYGYESSKISENWPKILKPLFSNEKLSVYFHRWVATGRGVEEFPNDPLKPENWEENVLSS
jgi:hypothetical protein